MPLTEMTPSVRSARGILMERGFSAPLDCEITAVANAIDLSLANGRDFVLAAWAEIDMLREAKAECCPEGYEAWCLAPLD